MSKIAVVYFSQTGVTEALVQALCESASLVQGCETQHLKIEGSDIIEGRFVNYAYFEALRDCDAIVFASPTYMGGVAAQFKAFCDATSELWCEQTWAGKLAAGMTCGAAFNGDQSTSLQYMATLASQQGMLWVSLDTPNGYGEHGVNRLGCQLGVVAQSDDGQVHAEDLATARYLGRRVAGLLRW
ncbi:MAG: flavodoxin family protein [Granulosicoccaceae bacterium]